jgi:dihydropteroate synthase
MRLRLRDSELELERGMPLLMGIVNATPDSFSDPPGQKALPWLAARAHALVQHGAGIVDVGGDSGRTDRAAVSAREESARVAPLVGRLAGDGLTVSVDTWRAEPARAALAAGAAMVNDVSGLADPGVAELCAEAGAALVITHNRAAPKQKRFPDYGDDVMADVLEFLGARAAAARARGVADDQLVLDPGLDLAKTPGQSVEVLSRIGELEALGHPLLLAISRKDFLGALTGRSPAERDAATLAAVEPALDCAAAVLRVHDVRAAADYVRVRAALRGDSPVALSDVLAEPLRREVAL